MPWGLNIIVWGFEAIVWGKKPDIWAKKGNGCIKKQTVGGGELSFSMKSKLILVNFAFFVSVLANSQEILIKGNAYIHYPNMMYEFKNNQTRFWSAGTLKNNGNDAVDLMGTYKISNQNGIDFVEFIMENNIKEKYLILYNENLCYLYRNDGYSGFRGYKLRGGAPGEVSFSVDNSNVEIKSSSYLIENDVEYSTGKLNENIGICWVEGTSGQGINEILYLKMGNTKSIHISNGFVSYNKPYLYRQNSRLKKIELSVENKYTTTFDLADTPNFQTINLPEVLLNNETLRIKIREVYPGDKYEDTCVNMILMDMVQY